MFCCCLPFPQLYPSHPLSSLDLRNQWLCFFPKSILAIAPWPPETWTIFLWLENHLWTASSSATWKSSPSLLQLPEAFYSKRPTILGGRVSTGSLWLPGFCSESAPIFHVLHMRARFTHTSICACQRSHQLISQLIHLFMANEDG